jgi:prepilin-type N-terminal cleavage/methylation domain-containing protein
MQIVAKQTGFTIVELLIVVVVIVVLATISFVAYGGIQRSAAVAALQSDLRNASRQLDIFQIENGRYPTEGELDLALSNDTDIEYTSDGSTFCVTASSSAAQTSFRVNEGNDTAEGPCEGHDGYISGEEVIVYTNESCFGFSAGEITNYYDNEGNNASNPACSRDVAIPNEIGGTAVTSIGSWTFEGNQLTGVTIPSSVTSLGSGAFYDNQLTSVTIPNSLTSIAASTFNTNQLTTVIIPSSITSIGDWAFEGNQLTEVTIPSSVTSLGSGAFRSNLLTSVTIPGSITSIEDWTFEGNQLTSATIPNSVSSIGDSSFLNNDLSSVTISSSATVGTDAFDAGVGINYY